MEQSGPRFGKRGFDKTNSSKKRFFNNDGSGESYEWMSLDAAKQADEKPKSKFGERKNSSFSGNNPRFNKDAGKRDDKRNNYSNSDRDSRPRRDFGDKPRFENNRSKYNEKSFGEKFGRNEDSTRIDRKKDFGKSDRKFSGERSEFKGRDRFSDKKDGENRTFSSDRRPFNQGRNDKPRFGEKKFSGDRADRPSFGEKKFSGERRDRPSFGEKKFSGDRTDRPKFGEKKFSGERTDRPKFGEKKFSGDQFLLICA